MYFFSNNQYLVFWYDGILWGLTATSIEGDWSYHRPPFVQALTNSNMYLALHFTTDYCQLISDLSCPISIHTSICSSSYTVIILIPDKYSDTWRLGGMWGLQLGLFTDILLYTERQKKFITSLKRVTLTKMHRIKINQIWTQVSYRTL